MGLQDDVPRVDKLLLEAYSQISEPDSIYAVARSPSLAVQLPLAEHEGSWAEALVGYDLQMHHADLQERLLPKGSSSMLAAHGWQQQPGLFNALQQLGCQHMLQKLFVAEGSTSGEVLPQPCNLMSVHLAQPTKISTML